MAIPGIKITQSAIDSYKASRALYDVHSIGRDTAVEIAKESAAMGRQPITSVLNQKPVSQIADAISYAVSHGTPEKVANNLDTIV